MCCFYYRSAFVVYGNLEVQVNTSKEKNEALLLRAAQTVLLTTSPQNCGVSSSCHSWPQTERSVPDSVDKHWKSVRIARGALSILGQKKRHGKCGESLICIVYTVSF